MKPTNDVLNSILASRQFITADLYRYNLANGSVLQYSQSAVDLTYANIALVQDAQNTAFGGGTSASVTLANAPTPGNIVVLTALGASSSAGTITLTVSDGTNSYQATPSGLKSSTAFNAACSIGIFYLVVPVGAGATITVTANRSINAFELYAAEYSGVDPVNPVDTDAFVAGGGPGTTINTPAITTRYNGDLIITHTQVQIASSSINPPWLQTPAQQAFSSNTGGDISAYLIQAVAGSQAPNFTQTSGLWNSYVAAFKPNNLWPSGSQSGPYFDRKDNKAKVTWKLGTGNDQLVIDVIPGSATIGNLSFLDAVRCGTFDAADFQLSRGFIQLYPEPQTVLLMHFDGTNGTQTFTDSSVFANVFTPQIALPFGAQLDTTNKKYGTASLNAEGSGITCPHSAAFAFVGNDFTVEAWFNCNDPTNGFGTIVSSANFGIGSNLSFELTRNGQGTTAVTGPIYFQYSLDGTSGSTVSVTGVTPFGAGVNPGWHHVAAQRSGNVLQLFIDGNLEASTPATGVVFDAGLGLGIGVNGAGAGNQWIGWIDEVRITNGIARYSGNFTPPGAPFDHTYVVPTIQPGCAVLMFQGRVAEVDADRSLATFTINDYRELLSQQLPRNLYAASCANSFGDASCTVVVANFSENGTVQTGTTQSAINTTLVRASDYYDMGKITFTSGLLKGLSFGVSTWTQGSPGIIVPYAAFPHVPAVGDTFTIAPGCDKLFTGGCTKYSNTPNFRGFPYTPAPETAL